MQIKEVIKVDKAEVAHLSFLKEEVLSIEADQMIRKHNLNRALRLGNGYKRSVLIQFENAVGEAIETEATIWAVTEKYIMLKGGAVIPIHAIFNVIV